MNRSEMEQTLKSSEFFKRLGKGDISKIAELCQVNTYETGEHIFRQGHSGIDIPVASVQ